MQINVKTKYFLIYFNKNKNLTLICKVRKVCQSERFSYMFNESIELIIAWHGLKLCKVA